MAFWHFSKVILNENKLLNGSGRGGFLSTHTPLDLPMSVLIAISGQLRPGCPVH